MSTSNDSTKPAGTRIADTTGASPSSKAASSGEGKGQKSSTERGSQTRSKKNPGKRAHQGGSSR